LFSQALTYYQLILDSFEIHNGKTPKLPLNDYGHNSEATECRAQVEPMEMLWEMKGKFYY